jgi:hypothetical protein
MPLPNLTFTSAIQKATMLNETMHPEAEELSNLLFAIGAQPEEDRAYHVLENRNEHMSDEAKADLYARIAEAPLAAVGKVRAVSIVSKCLWQNARAFPNGA